MDLGSACLRNLFQSNWGAWFPLQGFGFGVWGAVCRALVRPGLGCAAPIWGPHSGLRIEGARGRLHAGPGEAQVVSEGCLMGLGGCLLGPGPPCFSFVEFLVEQCLFGGDKCVAPARD